VPGFVSRAIVDRPAGRPAQPRVVCGDSVDWLSTKAPGWPGRRGRWPDLRQHRLLAIDGA
jgi:hypothetical protein